MYRLASHTVEINASAYLWMACFAMAMTPNDIEYEVLDTPLFTVTQPGTDAMPEGTFFHYYTDRHKGRGGPFVDSEWHKQLYRDRDFLKADLESFARNAASKIEQEFFALAMRARDRLHGGGA